jgi:hypothetical protein
MDKNFTPFQFSGVAFESVTLLNKSAASENLHIAEPSESVISNILNFSKALAVAESKISGTKHLLLLN